MQLPKKLVFSPSNPQSSGFTPVGLSTIRPESSSSPLAGSASPLSNGSHRRSSLRGKFSLSPEYNPTTPYAHNHNHSTIQMTTPHFMATPNSAGTPPLTANMTQRTSRRYQLEASKLLSPSMNLNEEDEGLLGKDEVSNRVKCLKISVTCQFYP